jgi:hypothetical protein
MPLNTVINLGVSALQTKAIDLATASTPLEYAKRITMTTGTGAGKADLIFSDQRTIAASGAEDLDLAAVLVDVFGTTLTYVKLKALVVFAAAANVNNVRITRPATNGVPLFIAASDGLDVVPGGMFAWVAPNAAAVTVTPATGDLINIGNGGSGTSVTYDVIIIGASA